MAMIIWGQFRRRRRSPTIATVAARALLSVILALAARGAPVPFQASLAAAHLLPSAVVGPLALALPWLAALYLAIGLFLRPVALVTAAALFLSTGMLVVHLTMGAPAFIVGVLAVAGPIGALPLPVFPMGPAGGAARIAVAVAGNVVAITLAAVVYGGDRHTLSVDGFLFGPLPADLLDEEDLPPNLVLLAPPPALYEDEDGA